MLVRLVVVAAAPILIGVAVLTPQLVTSTRSARSASAPAASALTDLTSSVRDTDLDADDPERDGMDLMDVYGNEVTAAVATYKFDAAGTLYELHSPKTEIPRLASPKS